MYMYYCIRSLGFFFLHNDFLSKAHVRHLAVTSGSKLTFVPGAEIIF